MRLRWALATRRDITSIVAFISAENPDAAREQVRRIERRAEDLIAYPLLGRPGRLRATRELVVPGTPYILIYRPLQDVVDILRVVHGARRWPPRRSGQG